MQTLETATSTQRYLPNVRDDELPLTQRIIELACMYGRYGYRRIAAMLRLEGWRVNHKRVERIWKKEELKVPRKQPKRGRLWFNGGSFVRLRSEYKDHVWSYNFVQARTHDGRSFRMLTVIDEHTRECLAIDVARNLRNGEIFYTLREAKVLINRWRTHYNTERPHSSLGYRPPAPETRITPSEACSATLRSPLMGQRNATALTLQVVQNVGAGHIRL